MPRLAEFIATPSGLMAILSTSSAHSCLACLQDAVDSYQVRYGVLPDAVDLADSLPDAYKWLLRKWLESQHIMWYAHYGETTWVLAQPPEGWRGTHDHHR